MPPALVRYVAYSGSYTLATTHEGYQSICQICGGGYRDDEPSLCTGCDECWRLFHFRCAGFMRLLPARKKWKCDKCH